VIVVDAKAEDNGRQDGDNGVEGELEKLKIGCGGEDATGGDNQRSDDDGEFGKRTEDAERESFGVGSGGFGAAIDKVGEGFGDVEFGTSVAIVEKKHDNGSSDEDAGHNAEKLGGRRKTEDLIGDKEGSTEEEDNNNAVAGDEAANQTFGFFGGVFTAGFMVEESEGAKAKLDGSVKKGSKKNCRKIDNVVSIHGLIVPCIKLYTFSERPGFGARFSIEYKNYNTLMLAGGKIGEYSRKIIRR